MAEYKHHHHHLILIGLVVVFLLLSNYTTTTLVQGRWIHHQYPTDDDLEKNKKLEDDDRLSRLEKNKTLEARRIEAKRREEGLLRDDDEEYMYSNNSTIRYTIQYGQLFRMNSNPLSIDMNNNPVYVCRRTACGLTGISIEDGSLTGISIEDWRRYKVAVKRPHGLFITDDDVSKCRIWLDLEKEEQNRPNPPTLYQHYQKKLDYLNAELIRSGVPARVVLVPLRRSSSRRRREAAADDDVDRKEEGSWPPYRTLGGFRTLGISEFARRRAEANSRPIFRFRSDPNWKKGMPESRGGTRIEY